MKKTTLLLLITVYFTACTAPNMKEIKCEVVKTDMQRVADWQIDHFRDAFSNKKPHHIADWTNAALYVGMVKWAEMSGDTKYWDFLMKVGKEQDWNLHHRKYMADDHAVGQMYIELYRKYADTAMINKTIERFNWIMENPSQQPISMDNYKHNERWTWCDALFMAPPVWAKLHTVTGDSKYTEWMMSEYQATYDHLYDTEEDLFYRDNSYFKKLVDGKKIFWSRGNGWVFAGLALIMDEYEEGSDYHDYFLTIYKDMAKKLIEIQTEEGFWSMSLLNAENFPTPETSGTSFYIFALAWGINNGILDYDTYEPHVRKGWNALTGVITKDGMLGYVQPIGAAPGEAWPDKSEVYGSGAFLAAGSEVYKLYK